MTRSGCDIGRKLKKGGGGLTSEILSGGGGGRLDSSEIFSGGRRALDSFEILTSKKKDYGYA